VFGSTIPSKFIFLKIKKLKKAISINDILKNPKKVKDITDVGIMYSLMSGLAERYRGG